MYYTTTVYYASLIDEGEIDRPHESVFYAHGYFERDRDLEEAQQCHNLEVKAFALELGNQNINHVSLQPWKPCVGESPGSCVFRA